MRSLLPIIPKRHILTSKGISFHTVNVESEQLCFLYSCLAILESQEIIDSNFQERVESALNTNEKRKLSSIMKKPGTYISVLNKIAEAGEYDFSSF